MFGLFVSRLMLGGWARRCKPTKVWFPLINNCPLYEARRRKLPAYLARIRTIVFRLDDSVCDASLTLDKPARYEANRLTAAPLSRPRHIRHRPGSYPD